MKNVKDSGGIKGDLGNIWIPNSLLPKDEKVDSLDLWDDYECYRPTNKKKFHIGGNHDSPARTMECVYCGGIDFHVGYRSFYTAIKCVKCGWEKMIHEG